MERGRERPTELRTASDPLHAKPTSSPSASFVFTPKLSSQKEKNRTGFRERISLCSADIGLFCASNAAGRRVVGAA